MTTVVPVSLKPLDPSRGASRPRFVAFCALGLWWQRINQDAGGVPPP